MHSQNQTLTTAVGVRLIDPGFGAVELLALQAGGNQTTAASTLAWWVTPAAGHTKLVVSSATLAYSS